MFVRVGVCAGCGFVAFGCGVVDVGLGGCVFVHMRLWRLCGGCWVTVMVGPEVAEWAEFLCDVELGSVGVPSFS